MQNFLPPMLVLLSVPKVEAKQPLVMCIEILDLVGDESEGYFSKINKEVIFIIVFVHKEVHITPF